MLNYISTEVQEQLCLELFLDSTDKKALKESFKLKKDYTIETIADAFLALNDIDDAEVADMIKPRKARSLSEGKSFSLNGSAEELKKAEEFLHDKGQTETEIEVIDPDADTVEHIKSKEQYIGQAILQCAKCGAKRFIDLDKLQVDPQDPELYNVEDECPNCKTAGDGYNLIGQVGKVQQEQTVEEEPQPETSEAPEQPETPEQPEENLPALEEEPAFDNDLEKEIELPAYGEEVKEELAEQPEEKKEKPKLKLRLKKAFTEEVCPKCGKVECECLNEEVDWSRLYAEEEDAIDSYQREIDRTDDSEETKLLQHIQDEEKEHKQELENAMQGDFDPIKETYCKDIVREALTKSEWAEKAWMLNQIIQCMNDEEAYYGGWLYIWPDECSREECEYYFGDEEDYRELEDSFIRKYKAYHSGGLYEAPEEVEKAAHEWDRKLGLAPIENIRRKLFREEVEEEEEEDEDDSPATLQDLLDCFVEPEKLENLIVFENGEKVFEGALEDLPEKYLDKELAAFNTAQSKFCINIDTEEESEDIVEDFLTLFDDEDTDQIIITESGSSDALFEGDKESIISRFGNEAFVSAETPECLQVIVGELPEEAPVEESLENNIKPGSLFEDICKANNLATYRADDPRAPEYWIKEAVDGYADETDQKTIYEAYVRGYGKDLETRFKKATGYREVVVENLDESEEFDDFDTSVQSDELAPPDYEEREEAQEESSEGFVHTRCAACGAINKVFVTFPAWNKPFLDTTYVCRNCGEKNTLTDPHEYNEDGTVVEESCNKTEVKEEKSNHRSCRNREELAEAIAECRKNNKPFKVSRSTNPEYRYDLEIDEAIPAIAAAAITSAAAGAGSRLVDKILGEDKIEEKNELAPRRNQAPEVVSDAEREVMREIQRISTDIADALHQLYGIEVNPVLVAADILQDLRLIGGAVRPEDLADNPLNNMTRQMFRDFNTACAAIDEISTMFGGEPLYNTPEAKLGLAIRALSSPTFSRDNIYRTMSSPRFIQAAQAGAVPYIEAEDRPLLEAFDNSNKMEFDTDAFDDKMNEHLNNLYPGEMYYSTDHGYVTDKGRVILEGALEGPASSRPVTFTLTPRKALTESLDSAEEVAKALKDSNFLVKNDLSDEVFLYENNTEPCVNLLANDRTASQVVEAFDKEFKDMPLDAADRADCIANWEYINNLPYYQEKGLDETYIKNALLTTQDLTEDLSPTKTLQEFYIPRLWETPETRLVERWAEANDISMRELDKSAAPDIAKDLLDLNIDDLVPENQADYDNLLRMVRRGLDEIAELYSKPHSFLYDRL